MRHRSGFVRRTLLGSALVLVVVSAAACTDDNSDQEAVNPSPKRSATAPGVTGDMPQYITAVNEANAEDESTVIAAGARPTVTQQDSGVMTMVIRDEGRDEWKAGSYRLVTHCAGSGTLYAYFKLGSTSEIKELLPCARSVTTGAVDLRLASAAKGSAVLIIPAGNTQAAVSYQIQRL